MKMQDNQVDKEWGKKGRLQKSIKQLCGVKLEDGQAINQVNDWVIIEPIIDNC